jgi:hypothetical protein
VSGVGDVPGVKPVEAAGTDPVDHDSGGLGRALQAGVPANFTPDERWILARMLAVWRYVGHNVHGGLVPTKASEQRRIQMLALAAKLGVTREYVRTLLDYPVMTVTIQELE